MRRWLSNLRRSRGSYRKVIKALDSLDAERIYVENVRVICGVSRSDAQRMLDIGVREGSFERCVGILCPHEEHIVQSFTFGASIPKDVHCLACEAEGRDFQHRSEGMERLSFYRFLQ